MTDASSAQILLCLLDPLERAVLDPLRLHPEPDQVWRYLGYPAGVVPGHAVRQRVERALDAAAPAHHARGAYAIYSVAMGAGRSQAPPQGFELPAAAAAILSGSTRVVVFLATAGLDATRLPLGSGSPGNETERLIADAVGSALAEAAAARILDHVRSRLSSGEALSNCYSPGFCGAPLEGQRLLFRLVDAALIGVHLLPSLLIKPVKSVSGLFGIGPVGAVREFENPCDICTLESCAMRRHERRGNSGIRSF